MARTSFRRRSFHFSVSNLLDCDVLPLHGDGGHVRDWLHVRDHCRAMFRVLHDGRSGEIYNVAGGSLLTNLELTRCLIEAVGASGADIRFVPDRPANDWRYALDASKLADDLGFVPAEPSSRGSGKRPGDMWTTGRGGSH